LAIYIWHYPLFWAVSRHTQAWSPESRVVVTLALLAVIVVAAQRYIEEPTRVWLRRSSWFRAPVVSHEGGQRDAERGIP
jgi:peptidoglycan/LPS O-acetylase OafA/YrhL